MDCNERCSGCALTPGATANQEVNNHIVAILSAVAAVPFHCHHRLGWTPEMPGYPQGEAKIERAFSNLTAAPKLIHDSPELGACVSDATATGVPAEIFDDDRKIVGRQSMCAGWKQTVAALKDVGHFADGGPRETARRCLLLVSQRPIPMEELKRETMAMMKQLNKATRAIVAKAMER